jgi:hypothetical protein
MAKPHSISRRLLIAGCLAAVLPPDVQAQSQDEAAWQALREGGIALFRHATAPGTGDPDDFKLGDCATQRNLNAEGRAQAQRIGAAFRARGLVPGAVLASQWCRTTETAELAFPGQVRAAPAFNSFFNDREDEPQQTAAARKILLDWKGPGPLFVSTHQVNITALTGITPASGEGIVLRPAGEALVIAGRIKP